MRGVGLKWKRLVWILFAWLFESLVRIYVQEDRPLLYVWSFRARKRLVALFFFSLTRIRASSATRKGIAKVFCFGANHLRAVMAGR